MQKKVTKSEKLIKEIRRSTRQVFNSEQKILIVIEDIHSIMLDGQWFSFLQVGFVF
jgi:hypothetical protein